MQTKAGYLLSILVLSIVLNCSNANEFYTVEIVDDVRIVHNIKPMWENDPKIELEFVKQIGDFDAVDENYIFFRPADIHIDADGNYYVLDSGNNRVQKYNIDGEFLLTMGRQGQGPGEMNSPFGISGDKEGNILVIDPGNTRIQKYSPDGKDLGSSRMPAGGPYVQHLSTGELVVQNRPEAKTLESTSLLSIYNENGGLVREMGKGVDFHDPVTNQFFLAVDKDDNIIGTFYGKNEILKFSKEGNPIFKTDRPLNYSIPDKLIMRTLTAPDGNTVEIPMMVFVSRGIRVDGKSRIWVSTMREQLSLDNAASYDPAAEKWDLHVFDSDGILLMKFEIDRTFYMFRIIGDRLFLVDTANTMSIYEYKIVEK